VTSRFFLPVSFFCANLFLCVVTTGLFSLCADPPFYVPFPLHWYFVSPQGYRRPPLINLSFPFRVIFFFFRVLSIKTFPLRIWDKPPPTNESPPPAKPLLLFLILEGHLICYSILFSRRTYYLSEGHPDRSGGISPHSGLGFFPPTAQLLACTTPRKGPSRPPKAAGSTFVALFLPPPVPLFYLYSLLPATLVLCDLP